MAFVISQRVYDEGANLVGWDYDRFSCTHFAESYFCPDQVSFVSGDALFALA
jgi:hypothetical protein